VTFKYLQVQNSVPENGGIMKFLAVPSADLHVLLIVYGAITSCHWMREKVLSSLIVPFSSDRLSLLPSCAHFIYLPTRRDSSSPRLPHQCIHRNRCRARPGGEKDPCNGTYDRRKGASPHVSRKSLQVFDAALLSPSIKVRGPG